MSNYLKSREMEQRFKAAFSSNPEVVNYWNNESLTEEERNDFLDKLKDEFKEKFSDEMKVSLGPTELTYADWSSGPKQEGKNTITVIEDSEEHENILKDDRYKLINKKSNTRELLSSDKEQLIEALDKSAINPKGLSNTQLASLLKDSKSLERLGWIKKGASSRLNQEAEERISGSVEGTAGKAALAGAINPVAKIGYGAMDYNPMGLLYWASMGEKTSDWWKGLNNHSDQVIQFNELEEAARGEIIEDFKALGATTSLMATGAGGGLMIRGMSPLKALATMGAIDGAASLTYADELPGVSTELMNLDKASLTGKAVTAAEGVLLSMIPQLPSALKALKGEGDLLLRLSGAKAKPIPEIVDGLVDTLGDTPVLDVRKTIKQELKDLEINTREQFNGWVRIKEMQKKSLAKIVDENDVYQNKRLLLPKLGALRNEVDKGFQAYHGIIEANAKSLNMSKVDFEQTVNNYAYAKHAIERNRFDKFAGIETEDARNLIGSIEKLDYFDSVKESADILRKQSKSILDTLESGGLVSTKMANDLRSKYKEYIPLNRVMDDLNEIDEYALGLRTVGRGIREAKGSERAIRDISKNIYDSLQGAVYKSQMNLDSQIMANYIRANKKQGIGAVKAVRYSPDKDGVLKPKPPESNAIRFYENGKAKDIVFNNKEIEESFKFMPKTSKNVFMRFLHGYNKVLGRMYIGYNPDFPLVNKVRDMTESFINTWAKTDLKTASSVLSPSKAGKDMRTIIQSFSGKNNPNTRLYKQFVMDGGSGGLSSDIFSKTKHSIDLIRDQKNFKDRIQKFDKFFENANKVFEDSTRFNVYKSALESGKTRKQAALMARDSSFDPLLGGKSTDLIKALYLFSNPAIQGGKNFIRSMSNPKVLAGVTGTILSLEYFQDMWNSYIDPEWKEKIPQWQRDKNIVFMSGENTPNFSIPIAYPLIPLKTTIGRIFDYNTGRISDKVKIAKDIGSEIIDAYNPLGGSVAPTISRTYLELILNKDGLGREIRPEYLEKENMHEYARVKHDTPERFGGQIAIDFSKKLLDEYGLEVNPENMLYLYSSYFGAPGSTMERILTVGSDISNNKKPSIKDLPVLRRFFGENMSRTGKMYSSPTEDLVELEKDQQTERILKNREDYNIANKIKNAKTQADRLDALGGIDPKDTNRLRSISRKLEMLELTSNDKIIKKLGVKDLTRAKYYLSVKSKLSNDAYLEYLQEQKKKGLLTNNVLKQMLVLQKLETSNN